jgi:hypothetical protein
MRRLRERPYFLLLAAILALLVVYPVLHETAGARVVYDVLRAVVLLASIRVVFAQHKPRLLGLLLAAVLVLAVAFGDALPVRLPLQVVLTLHALATAFFALAVGSILQQVYRTAEVNADGVAGALCAYLLLGVVFAHVYWFIQYALPGSFRGDGEFRAELDDPRQSLFALTYYSFVTLAAVGANDITPVRPAARGVIVLEAIGGQFYIAVLIADLIGKKLSAAAHPTAGQSGGPAVLPDATTDRHGSAAGPGAVVSDRRGPPCVRTLFRRQS